MPTKLIRQGFVATAIALHFVLLAIGLTPALQAKSPVQDGYNPEVKGLIFDSVMQPDGKLIVAGDFSSIGGQARTHLARLNVDGTLDSSFNPTIDKPVTALALKGDGSVIIGGTFKKVNNVTVNHLARVRADGSVDQEFLPGVDHAAVPATFRLEAIAIQHDGKVLVGGFFDTFKPVGSGTATAVTHIVRLNADGSLDANFKIYLDNIVMAILVRADGKIVLGGGFTTASRFPTDLTGTRRSVGRIAMYAGNATIIEHFVPSFNNRVNVLLDDKEGGVYVGGLFTAVQPMDLTITAFPGLAPSRNVNNLARLKFNGTLHATFDTTVNGEVLDIAHQPNGGMLIAGRFTEAVAAEPYRRVSVAYLARLKPDGTPDADFLPSLNQVVTTIAQQADGNIVIGGSFSRIGVGGDALLSARNRLARLLPDGSLDTDFVTPTSGTYTNVLKLKDGRNLIYGSFNDIGGLTRTGAAIIDNTGLLDTSFKLTINAPVVAAAQQSDGKIVIVGGFTEVNSTKVNYIARVDLTGALDSTFDPPDLDAAVTSIAVQTDDKLLIGGSFYEINDEVHYYMARLEKNGAHDKAYKPAPSATPVAIYARPDGTSYICGSFTFFNPNAGKTVYAPYIAHILADGTIDTKFSANLSGAVNAIQFMEDGTFYVGGSFTGMTYIENETTYEISGVARLKADGSVDKAFTVDLNGAVRSLLVVGDKIYIAGTFTKVGEAEAYYFARVLNTGAFESSFLPSPDGAVTALQALPNGSILAMGTFANLIPASSTTTVSAEGIAAVKATGEKDPAFTLKAPAAAAAQGRINFIVPQADSSLLVGGSFTEGIKGTRSANLTRLSQAGRVDFSLSAATNGPVNSAALLPVDISILTKSVGATWLNASGTIPYVPLLDLPNIDGTVLAIARQADGKFLLGGAFTLLDNGSYVNLLRINTDGKLDTSFTPITMNGSVLSILVQDDGKILIGGNFTSINSVTRNYFARLSSSGALDTTYNPNFSGAVNTAMLIRDTAGVATHVLVGGAFTTVYGTGTEVSTRYYVAKLALADGALDTAFVPAVNAAVYSLVYDSEKRLLIGGAFSSVKGQGEDAYTTKYYLARLTAEGKVDKDFDPAPNGTVYVIHLESGGTMLVGGNFTSFTPNAATTATDRTYFARVKADGTLDALDLKINAAVTDIVPQGTTHLVISGSFTSVGEQTRIAVARLTVAGVLEPAIDQILNSAAVQAIAIGADNSIVLGGSFSRVRTMPALYVGGAFTKIGTTTTSNLARLYLDGAIDLTFLPNPNGKINATLLQADGKVVVAGAFTQIAGQAKSYIARFNADGTLDTGYAASLDAEVHTLMLLADGRLVAGGAFSGRLVCLKADGTVDASFPLSSSVTVSCLAMTPSGHLIAGSASAPYLQAFTSSGAISVVQPDGAVNALAVLADGRVLLGGAFNKVGTVDAKRFARLNAALSGLDGSTLLTSINADVTALYVTDDGKTILGGSFSEMDSQDRFMLARLAAPSPAAQLITANSSDNTLTWTRSGSLAFLTRAYLDYSSDDTNWSSRGALVRTGDNWSISLASIPSTGEFRARGYVASSTGASLGLVERASGTSASVLVDNSDISALTGHQNTTFSLSINAAVGGMVYSVEGLPAGLNFDAGLGIIFGAPHDLGTSTITVKWFDGIRNRTSTVTLTVSTPYRIANMSVRALLQPNAVVTPGFIISGSAPKQVLIRVVGPSLLEYGVENYLKSPSFSLFKDGTSTTIDLNQGAWGNDSAVKAVADSLGAFPLVAGRADCAKVYTLAPGAYTLQIRGNASDSGVVLAEVYDATADIYSQTQQLVNVSGNTYSGTNAADIITTGFILNAANGSRQRILIRAVSQTLAGAPYNSVGMMADPVLNVYVGSTLVASNADGATQTTINVDYAPLIDSELAAALASSGAFALSPSDTTSAYIVLDLPPGAYTAQAAPAPNTAAGNVLLEVYQIRN